MWLWLTIGLKGVAAECPQTNLFASGLDVYSVVLFEETLRFQFSVQDQVVYRQSVGEWRQMLQSCNAKETLTRLSDWEEQQLILQRLGVQRETLSLGKRWMLRRRILEQEKITALAYAHMLEILEKETGIAVLWNLTETPRTRGMVSTARGSERIADYIQIMYGAE